MSSLQDIISSDNVVEKIKKSISTRHKAAQVDALEPLRQHSRDTIKRFNTEVRGNSSVRSGSVEDERLNGGRPTLIPFLWDGRMVGLDEAIERAVASQKAWPAFNSNEAADKASKRLSASLGRTKSD